MFYMADKVSFSVNLSELKAAKVNVSWINPITGVELGAHLAIMVAL